jgi:hypothetical protein
MAVTNTPVPMEYARIELIAGSVQSGVGGLGIGLCATDRECKNGAGLPFLIGFTAWTAAMAIHGSVALFGPNRHRAPERMKLLSTTRGFGYRESLTAPPKGQSISLAPIIGDGRSAPAGVGIVGTF